MSIQIPNVQEPFLGNSDAELIVKLSLQDFDEYKSHQKGKGRAGELSDADEAVKLWEDELQRTESCLKDERLAHSLSGAIAADQHLLSQFQREEVLWQQDHLLALAMANDDVQDEEKQVPRSVQGDSDVELDSVCEVLGSLAEMTSTQGEASKDAHTKLRAATVNQCVSCLEHVRSAAIFTPTCGHFYCKDCTKEMFLAATKDEELYPPRCCGTVFPPGIALRLLDYRELAAFGSKGVEFSSTDRTYCADPSCSTFIPPWKIQSQLAICPQCSQSTHTVCKALNEGEHECPKDTDLQQVLLLAETENWRRCPQCRTLVELRQGCNHITCRCGKHFCYVCGANWRSCHCPAWDENRLYNIADRVANDEAPHADEDERRHVVDRVVEELRNHEDVGCEHVRRSQWNYRGTPDSQCEVCFDVLPNYIFECRSCRMLACNRCMRNRMR